MVRTHDRKYSPSWALVMVEVCLFRERRSHMAMVLMAFSSPLFRRLVEP
jgi:hypothetical protein